MKRFFVILAAAALLTAACGDAPAPAPAPEAAIADVETATAELVEVPDVVYSLGTVEAVREATLSAKVMGAVRALDADEGDRVRKGDTLVVLDAADIEAKRREAVQAKAGAEAAIAEAKAALDNAQVNLGRMEALYGEQAVTKKELDDAATHHKMAEARLGQAEAAFARAEAAVAQADVMLGYSVIRAPFDGAVVEKYISLSEMASPGMPLVKLVDDRKLRLRTTAAEGDASSVKEGARVNVRIDALGGTELPGTVSEVVPAADPATRSFVVKIDLPAAGGLLPGMSGRASLPRGTRSAVVLPDGALVDREGMQGVFVVTEKGTLAFQAVRLGPELRLQTGGGPGGGREVLAGLSGGETVAVGELSSVKEGMTARPASQ